MKKPKKTEQTFRGWDWTEISDWLGIDTEALNEEDLVVATRGELRKLCLTPMSGASTDPTYHSDMIKIRGIRTFVKRLSEGDVGSSQSLFNGLYKIEDDYTFLKYVDVLLECLWN